jgi:ABC-type phosphate/phosphonate transport system substrate-binding protein
MSIREHGRRGGTMRRLTLRISALVPVVTLVMMASATRAAEPNNAPPEKVRIGIVQSLFRDAPRPMVKALMQPFAALMKSQTEIDGDLIASGDALHLGRQLAEDKMDLGVFQGIEFAWAQQKYPELRPLMIVINQKSALRAYLVVKAGSNVTQFDDLKDKSVAMPRFSHEHCYQFLQRLCQGEGMDRQRFLAKITKPASVEEALDDLADGAVQAALVEEVPFECYQRRKPGRCKQLTVLERSEVFPASVIAYHPGHLDDEIIERFRQGMLSAHKNPVGRQLLTLWRLTGFQVPPDDYQPLLAAIVKRYPPPAEATKDAARLPLSKRD